MKATSCSAWGFLILIAAAVRGIAAPPWTEERGQVTDRSLQTVTVPSAPATLTLDQALQLGFANNAGFRSAIAALLKAQDDLRVARQLYALTLTGSTGATHSGADGDVTRTDLEGALDYEMLSGASVSVSVLLDRLDSEESSTLELVATQPLIRGAGRSSARYEALRSKYSGYRSAILRYFLSRQDLGLDIIKSYFSVVLAQQQAAIQEQGLAQADRAVQDAEARLKEGMTTRIEVARARLSQASRRLGLTRAKQSYQDSLDVFLKTLGLQVGTTPELTTKLAYSPVSLEVEALVSEALGNRAELAIEELALQDAQAAVRLSRNRRSPALDLFGSSSSPFSGGNGETEWTVGIQTRVPINSRALDEAVRLAERERLLAQRSQTEVKQSIATQVRSRVHALESQQATVQILEQSLEVAREKLRLADISVEEGVGLYRDKIEAQDEVTSAERDLIDAQIRHYFVVLDLRRAVGRNVLEGLPGETQAVEPAAAQVEPKS